MDIYAWARAREKAHAKGGGAEKPVTPFDTAMDALERIGQLETEYGREVLEQAKAETQRLVAAGILDQDQLPRGCR